MVACCHGDLQVNKHHDTALFLPLDHKILSFLHTLVKQDYFLIIIIIMIQFELKIYSKYMFKVAEN